MNLITSTLETNGIGFDWDRYSEQLLNRKISEQRDLIEKIALKLDCCTHDVTNSTKLIWKLYANKIYPESLSHEYLKSKRDSHEIYALLYQNKRLQQFINQYGDKLRQQIREGRIHAKWSIDGAKTGRMICTNPNLQAFPKELSPFFQARDGYCFIRGDYSQIELRVLAELSKDHCLITQLSHNCDAHLNTASKIYHKPPQEITPEERELGKKINFGMCYGISAHGLCQLIHKATGQAITLEQADGIKQHFYSSYPSVRSYHNDLLKAKEIHSLGGAVWKDFASTIAKINLPVQASAAEGLKLALSILLERLPRNCFLVNVIHDEIVLEAPHSQEDHIAALLKDCMIDGMTQLVKSVPIIVNIK